ncbi:MAG: hypothetical protein JXR46_03425 [Calditrichaceae bacterium]|nr:hypothetical protein [Calditrichaceae bacterium]MBN2708074.1 hypothetical protein [Calditrichaceae bacterium]RQV92495.1 MAG: hypothetical protein EH224_15335 [Calditrichota bacterium]
MTRFKKIYLTAFFCLAVTGVFAQDYDFDIPEEEESRLEFNGNLDAKWGLLQIRETSPFYGIQFYNMPVKDDYLSQYRLDFYLDGVYRYKQIGVFMKTFSQYVKEEPISASFFELYGSVSLSPRLQMSIGKRRFNWGTGYAFNPVGYANAEKDPENPDLALAGRTSVYFNYNRSFTSGFLQNFSISALLLPPEAESVQKYASADKIGAALKLYFLLNDIDIDLMTSYTKNEPKKLGLDFSTNVMENIEIHAEYSYLFDENKYFIEDTSVYRLKQNGGSYLMGIRYLNRFNTTVIAEYYHNNSGLTKNEFNSYLNYLQNSIDAGIPELVNAAKMNISTTFRSKTLMRDYLYAKIIQPEPFSLLYVNASIFSIFNLTDNSFLISPQFGYKPYTNFEIMLWPFFFFGAKDSEYGSKQFRKKIELWMRFFF